MTRCGAERALTTVAALAMLTVAPASAQNQRDATHPCNRACLEGFVTRYLEAMVAHDPAPLPVTAGVLFTENDVPLRLGEALLVLLVVLLDAKRKERILRMVFTRQNVIREKVAQAHEDVDHGRLEFAFVEHFVAKPEQPKPLNRIGRVQGALQRQVGVEVLQHQNRLIDQKFSLPER